MFWWILTAVCFVVAIAGIIGRICTDDLTVWPLVLIAFGTAIGAILLVVCIVVPIRCAKDISAYERQKAYIESHIPDNPVEDAALTNEKIARNEWLYEVQYTAENYEIFVFCPDEKLALAPIE